MACISIVFLTLIALMTTRCVAFARLTRLVLTNEGLTYHTPGCTVTTSWTNIRRITPSGRVIVTYRPQVQMRAWYWLTSPIIFVRGRIPLWLFAYGRGTPLTRAIMAYAPHLDPAAGTETPAR